MPDSPLPTPPPAQVVRFRLRTLLAITTGIAVLAAIAGPFYRRQTPAAQTHLLAVWSTGLLFTAVVIWHHVRWTYRTFRTGGTLRYILRSAWHASRFGAKGQTLIAIFSVAMLALMVTVKSRADVRMIDRQGGGAEVPSAMLEGLWFGIMFGGAFYGVFPRAIGLLEKGVADHRRLIPWKQFRYAEWMMSSAGVLMLHRCGGGLFVGDIFLHVPRAHREEIEAFIHAKIVENQSIVDGHPSAAPWHPSKLTAVEPLDRDKSSEPESR